MTYYKDEKKRIGVTYKLLVFGIVFINLLNLMSFAVSSKRSIYGSSWPEGTGAIPFFSNDLLGGMVIIFLYMNYKLFWINEQGEKAFLPKKYEITPLTLKEIYGAKIRIMVNTVIVYMIGSVGCYYFVLLCNRYPVMDLRENIIEIAEAVLAMAVFALFFLLYDFITYLGIERKS